MRVARDRGLGGKSPRTKWASPYGSLLALLALDQGELPSWIGNGTEERVDVFLKEVVAVVKHTFDVQVGNASVIGVIKVVNQVIGVLSQALQLGEQPFADQSFTDTCVATISTADRQTLIEVLFDVPHQQGIRRASRESNDIHA